MQSADLGASPKAVSAWLVLSERDEQAEPLETQMPFPERKWSIVSLLIFGSVMLRM